MKNTTLLLVLLAAGISCGQVITYELNNLPAPPSFYNWTIEGQYEWNTSIDWLMGQNRKIFYEPCFPIEIYNQEQTNNGVELWKKNTKPTWTQ